MRRPIAAVAVAVVVLAAAGLGRGYARGPLAPDPFWTYTFPPLEINGGQHPQDIAVNMLALSRASTGIRIDSEVQIVAPSN